MISEGMQAPDFELPTDTGAPLRLSSLRGEPVVLYFYPRDATPGCTTQACGIRDAWDALSATSATVLGISPDSVASHARFKESYELPFTLLADTEHVVAEAYGTWVEKTRYGRTYMGIARSTFVIDAVGIVTGVLRNVKPAMHAEQLLEALASLGDTKTASASPRA